VLSPANYGQSASNWIDSFDTILEAYEDISEQLLLLSDYESLFRENPEMVGALELMYVDILEFHQEALLFFGGTGKGKYFRIHHLVLIVTEVKSGGKCSKQCGRISAQNSMEF
jgi:hypothetical protein